MASTPATMLKIVSSGLEDISRLNPVEGQPSLSYFKTVIRKRTRWASQWRRVEFDNIADFGRTATVTLPILGELITRAVLVVVLPDIVTPQEQALQAGKDQYPSDPEQTTVYPAWSWTNSIGHALCSSISMSISNQVIDSFDSRHLEVIDEQHASFDHFDTTNFMIGRDPSTFNPLNYNSLSKVLGQVKTTIQSPQTVQVVPPFWWNRGIGPQPLPIQALAKDTVQLSCTFRPVQSLVYTDYRVGHNAPISITEGAGPLPNIASAGFYYPRSAGVPISQYGRNPATGLALPPTRASLVPGATMPAEYHFIDAYWIVEYVSLEDREAAAFRLAELQIPIETHVALPVAPTNGAAKTRVDVEQGGLVRDITWVAQRIEAPSYNAYFLFSRDLAESGASDAETPWWPDAIFPSWDYGDGYIQTGFSIKRSDPLLSATLRLGGKERFSFSGPSLFRSLMPVINCKRAPLVNRYIYRYDFGLWATGGIADAYDRPRDEIRGSANWDKITTKELEFMTADDYYIPQWDIPAVPNVILFSRSTGFDEFYGNDFRINTTVQGFLITMYGAGGGYLGQGAYLQFILDNTVLKNISGFKNIFVRSIPNGSIALVVETTTGYSYIAVAGAGGAGGDAGSVLICGNQGGTGDIPGSPQNQKQSIFGSGLSFGGGGGGGRSYAGSTTIEGPGLPDGAPMTTDYEFLTSGLSVGGSTYGFQGGDGYYGGGSGTIGGGGGGSYASEYCNYVISNVLPRSYNILGGVYSFRESAMTIVNISTFPHSRPSYNIYAWLTTYNMLKIKAGRGVLMFQ
jgi:hypothetical protein